MPCPGKAPATGKNSRKNEFDCLLLNYIETLYYNKKAVNGNNINACQKISTGTRDQSLRKG
jgi:hypothetical protein